LKIIIIIPTLNENNNILILIRKIQKLKRTMSILIIDDNSKDGTKEKILQLNKTYKYIKFIFRKKRMGIGSAHKEGIRWAYKKKFDVCITMDADGTHNPIQINKMINLLKNKKYNIISTSRFLLPSSLEDWSLTRKLITTIRFFLVKIILNTKLDSSGGYRCYDLKEINKIHFKIAKNNSYFFLIESLFYFERLKYKIHEISTVLKFRFNGESKMRFRDIFISLYELFKLRLFNKL